MVSKSKIFVITVLCLVVTSILVPMLIQRAYAQEYDDRDDDKAKKSEMTRAAKQIYREAIDLYDRDMYWDSARDLVILMDYYPEFSEMDGVVYYLAECLYEEELTAASLKMFKYLLRKYPDSEYVSAALFGLEKSSYQEGNYKDTLTIYYRILQHLNNESIIDAARYFAGQSHYYLQNYDTAIDIFRQISTNSEYYDGALYTTALACLRKKSVSTSIEYFRKLVSMPVINGERKRIVDDAKLTLGFINYELGFFTDAVKLFSTVSEDHDNYQDALLALGWANLKLDRYEESIKPLLKLVQLFPGSANAEEAYFVLGQAYIMTGEYDKSIATYRNITKLYPNPSNHLSIIKKVYNSLAVEESKLEQLKVQLLIQESNLLVTLPLNGYSDEVPEYMIEQKKKLENYREELVGMLISERDHLAGMKTQIEQLQQLAERKEKRKDWRGYAEYGISRAMFLKEMEQRASN
ncbi:tetratricopeptide repeat protein [candidate division KSB1 bacterium]|nr:tetratricopeptide repeat protein [candidate division KSB1 bacterium]